VARQRRSAVAAIKDEAAEKGEAGDSLVKRGGKFVGVKGVKALKKAGRAPRRLAVIVRARGAERSVKGHLLTDVGFRFRDVTQGERGKLAKKVRFRAIT